MSEHPSAKPLWDAFADSLHRERIFGCLLAFISGFVDTAGFIMLFRLFTAHITGNLIVAAAGFTSIGRDVMWIRLAVVAIFVASVAMSTVLTSWLRQLGHSPIRWLLWCEALALACFALVGTNYGPEVITSSEPLLVGVASLAVIAMGIHIIINKQTSYTLGLTNVMTNNLTMLTIDTTQIILHRLGRSAMDDVVATQSRHRILTNITMLSGFVTGVIAAGLTIPLLAYLAIYLPLSVVMLLAVTCRDRAECV